MDECPETISDFELPGSDGDEITTYRLSDYTDEGAVVLVLYPFDFSPVCTEVLCAFRDAEWLTLTESVDVFGLSRDSSYAHKRFAQEYEIPFPLLTDTAGAVVERLGLAYEEWENHTNVPKRALVALDDSHTVRYTWQTADAYNSPSLDELHDTVRSITRQESS